MSEYTPAPWYNHANHMILDGNNNPYNYDMRICDNVRSQDAQLIAAAPELLEALELIIFDIECLEPIKKGHIEDAYAAIAKAKGQE